MSVRVRIPPSPTGYLHVGNARVALFNYLFAKQNGGSIIIRIEDTNRELYKPEFETSIIESLAWLGISADEGPSEGGPYAPYRQSERGRYYREILERLIAEEKAFYCPHQSFKDEFTVHWCDQREENGTEGIIRFKTPRNSRIVFQDAVRGEISIDTETIGDFSIAKDLDTALYNLAVAADDYAMKISHIIRGEDHIANTPKQILIYQALGIDVPYFAHLPFLLGTDRSKLSKRHGATSVVEFRDKGYLPEALLNYLALLGWNPGTDQEIFSLKELIEQFSLERVQKSGAIFDVEKLNWMNGEYIRKMADEELLDRMRPFLRTGVDAESAEREKLLKIVQVEKPRLKTLAEIGEKIKYFFEAPLPDKGLIRWKEMTDEEIAASLDISCETLRSMGEWPTKEELEEALMAKAVEGRDKGRLLWPLRASLTGLKASPGPFEVIWILGRDEAIRRIESAKRAFTG